MKEGISGSKESYVSASGVSQTMLPAEGLSAGSIKRHAVSL